MRSTNRHSFIRSLKRKGLKEEIVIKIGLYDLVTSTTLESHKSLPQLVMNLKLHFDEERKNHKAVSTRNPTLRTAQGLDIGEITVKSIMAAYRHHEPTLAAQAAKPRGKPAYRAAVNLQPVIREDVRAKNCAGQRVSVGKLWQYLRETHTADIPPVDRKSVV